MAGRRAACWSVWLLIAVYATHAFAWGQAPTVETVEIKPEPFKPQPGSPLSERALVTKPGAVRGVLSWTVETRRHRGGCRVGRGTLHNKTIRGPE